MWTSVSVSVYPWSYLESGVSGRVKVGIRCLSLREVQRREGGELDGVYKHTFSSLVVNVPPVYDYKNRSFFSLTIENKKRKTPQTTEERKPTTDI